VRYINTKNKMETGEKSNTKKSNRRKFGLSLRYNRWLVRNIPFYFFLAALAVIYIANGHYADKMVRKINKTEKNLKEMEYEYKTVKRDVTFRSKESELSKAVEPLGLYPLVIPPVRITDTLNNK
jgi:predicted membrane protein